MALLIALTTLSGFSAAGDNEYRIDDEELRVGWWNSQSQREHRAKNPLGINSPDVKKLIARIKKDVEIKPYDGAIVFNAGEDEKFSVQGAMDGSILDEAQLRQDIERAIKTGGKVTAHTRPLPHRPEHEVIANLGLRGGYTTYFESNPNREHNIELALSKFNGLTVENGQTISFNKVVGPRSASRGFQEAKIILDGEFVPGIGGGVCQASTTVFNAVLLAGLTVDKSHNHSLAISYVPIGRDAMVSSGADLVFTNDTGGTIYIEAGLKHATPSHVGNAWVKIYGNKTKVKYKPRVECTESELGENELDPERRSKTYIEAWSGDRLVHSKLVRRSRYKAIVAD